MKKYIIKKTNGGAAKVYHTTLECGGCKNFKENGWRMIDWDGVVARGISLCRTCPEDG